nr:3'-5' exonuclease [uncultured Peptostreptococcus sp.]
MDFFDDEYVVVDLETTGLSPFNGDEIIEIGVTEIKGNEILRNYSRLIKPIAFIPSHITEITKITNDMVEDALTIEDVLPKFRNYIGDRTIIAHNAKFDVGFLNFYLDKMGLKPIEKYICTIEMLKKNKDYKGKNKKLQTACDFYGILNENAHRADSDTLATAKLFMKIRMSI